MEFLPYIVPFCTLCTFASRQCPLKGRQCPQRKWVGKPIKKSTHFHKRLKIFAALHRVRTSLGLETPRCRECCKKCTSALNAYVPLHSSCTSGSSRSTTSYARTTRRHDVGSESDVRRIARFNLHLVRLTIATREMHSRK